MNVIEAVRAAVDQGKVIRRKVWSKEWKARLYDYELGRDPHCYDHDVYAASTGGSMTPLSYEDILADDWEVVE